MPVGGSIIAYTIFLGLSNARCGGANQPGFFFRQLFLGILGGGRVTKKSRGPGPRPLRPLRDPWTPEPGATNAGTNGVPADNGSRGGGRNPPYQGPAEFQFTPSQNKSSQI